MPRQRGQTIEIASSQFPKNVQIGSPISLFCSTSYIQHPVTLLRQEASEEQAEQQQQQQQQVNKS